MVDSPVRRAGIFAIAFLISGSLPGFLEILLRFGLVSKQAHWGKCILKEFRSLVWSFAPFSLRVDDALMGGFAESFLIYLDLETIHGGGGVDSLELRGGLAVDGS